MRPNRRRRSSTGCGAPVGVAGAVLGMPDGGACDDSADIAVHSSHDTAQSQMSPSA